MIEILTQDAIIDGEDYCRPLEFSDSESNIHYTENQYSGIPINNYKWIKVKNILGDCWLGRTIADYYSDGVALEMEFARGSIPENHIL